MKQLQELHQLHQLQLLAMATRTFHQNIPMLATTQDSARWSFKPSQSMATAQDFGVLKRILLELSDAEHYVSAGGVEEALRRRDPEIFKRTGKRTLKDLIIQANKAGVPVAWLYADRAPQGKDCLRLTYPATHYVMLVKLLLLVCTEEKPFGIESPAIRYLLHNNDPDFWARRTNPALPPSRPKNAKRKTGEFRRLIGEAQRLGAPVKWTSSKELGALGNHADYVSLVWDEVPSSESAR